MILVDTGPLVALFDPADACHDPHRGLPSADAGERGQPSAHDTTLSRAFELMAQYANVPMDLADASLVVAAERFNARKVFTIDRTDFAIYRVRRGHRHLGFEVLG